MCYGWEGWMLCKGCGNTRKYRKLFLTTREAVPLLVCWKLHLKIFILSLFNIMRLWSMRSCHRDFTWRWISSEVISLPNGSVKGKLGCLCVVVRWIDTKILVIESIGQQFFSWNKGLSTVGACPSPSQHCPSVCISSEGRTLRRSQPDRPGKTRQTRVSGWVSPPSHAKIHDYFWWLCLHRIKSRVSPFRSFLMNQLVVTAHHGAQVYCGLVPSTPVLLQSPYCVDRGDALHVCQAPDTTVLAFHLCSNWTSPSREQCLPSKIIQ